MTDLKLRNRIFISEFFGELIPVYAIFPIMLVERGGITAGGVGVLLAIWQLTILISEIPTGIVADKYGRRISMLAGKLLRVSAMVFWLFMPNFTGYLIGFLLLGVGDALLSGSLEAYTYDELKDKSLFNRIRQKTVSIHLASFATAGLIAYLLKANYSQIMVVSLGMAVIASILATIIPADKKHSKVGLTTRSLLRTARKSLRPSRPAFMPFIRASIILAIMIVFIEYLSTFYRATGVSTQTAALLMSIGNAITFFLLWFAHFYETWIKRYQNALLILFSTLLGVSIFVPLGIAMQIGLIFVLVRIVRVSNIHLSNDLQHSVDSEARATIGSLASFVAKVGAALSMVFIGMSARDGDIRIPLFVAGSVLILLLVSTYVVGVKRHANS